MDGFTKNAKTVIPEPESGPGQVRCGIQKYLKLLAPGFRRGDGNRGFSGFYDSVNILRHVFGATLGFRKDSHVRF
jgi:hypothetical protein